MRLNIKSIYILATFFILTILLSSVSALEFVEDYNLTKTDFYKDNSSDPAFILDVPASSNFTLIGDYSGEIKNDDGKGFLATYVNLGEYAEDAGLICYLEDDTDTGSIIIESLTQFEDSYKMVSDEDGMLVLKLNEASDNSTESDNSTVDANSTEAFDEMTSAQTDSQDPEYAIVCTNEENDRLFVLFGDNLDLLKDMCENLSFVF